MKKKDLRDLKGYFHNYFLHHRSQNSSNWGIHPNGIWFEPSKHRHGGNLHYDLDRLWPAGSAPKTHWVFFCFSAVFIDLGGSNFLNNILASKAQSALLPLATFSKIPDNPVSEIPVRTAPACAHGSIPDWVDLADLITSSGLCWLNVGRMLAPFLGKLRVFACWNCRVFFFNTPVWNRSELQIPPVN